MDLLFIILYAVRTMLLTLGTGALAVLAATDNGVHGWPAVACYMGGMLAGGCVEVGLICTER